uniref:Protein xmas-2 n=1 Tax=Cacopsylla melanoneura TaxID=428564 RepID=A0A8D8XKC0_9HEMI
MELEALKPSKVIFMTHVPDAILDKRLMRQHFSMFGTVRRVSIDKESACCSICFLTNEAAHKAFLEGTVMDNYKLKIMLGTSSGPSVNEKTEPLRDNQTYDDLDMTYLDDNNDVFVSDDIPDIDDDKSEKELFKMKKKIIRDLHQEKGESSKDVLRKTRKVSNLKDSKLFKKPSSATVTSADMSKVRSLKKKYEMLELRDKLYREKLKATKINVNSGTCPDMCPEKERIMRAYRKLWAPYEVKPGMSRLAPELAVKEYSRSSANQEEPLPHELRPEPVLTFTMNYLILNIMPKIELPDANISQWYDFLWDRLRGIRKDIVQQQLCSVETATIIEQCARFHILCFDRFCGEDSSIFDEKINTENLNNCLQSLIHMYDDLNAQGLTCPNEPEFRAYEILLKLDRGDIIWEFQQLSPCLQTAPEILFALRVFSAFNNNLYSQFFKLIKQTTYLNACLLQRNVSFVRSRALHGITKAFCRPQDQSFKSASSYIKDSLKFDTDNDVLDFCSAHGMLLTDDEDLTIGKNEFSMPTSVSSCLATSLNMIKVKRALLPVTIAGPAGIPQEVSHKVHSSFDSEGNLTSLARNAVDQTNKLRKDFGVVVDNIPHIEINENMLSDYAKEIESPKSNSGNNSAGVSNVYSNKPDNKPVETSSEIFKTNPFQKEIFKTNPFPKEGDNVLFSKSTGGLFKTIDNSSQNKPQTSSIETRNDSDSNLFKKPFPMTSRFSTQPNDSNLFAKPYSNISQTSSSRSNSFLKNVESTIHEKAIDGQFSKPVVTDENLFKKPAATNLFTKPSESNLFTKQPFMGSSDLFKKAIADSNNTDNTTSSSRLFQNVVTNASSDLFSKVTIPNQIPGTNVTIFGNKMSNEPSNIADKFNTNAFGKPVEPLFQRPSTFSEFMKPSGSFKESSTKDENSSFNFLQKVSEIKSTSQNISPIKNSGFENSFELFVKESNQQARKRAADNDQEENRVKEFEALQKEKEKRRLIELEQQAQKEMEMQKQKEKELEMKRQEEMKLKREREIEMEKQRQLKEQIQKRLEEERQRELEEEKLRQIEIEKQREWEMNVKQEVIDKKVEYEFQIAMNNLAKAQKKKNKEHEQAMIQMRKERELRKLRKIVKKKIKFIHAKKCIRKWKDRVKRLKINKLEFPEVVLASIENHTAVWGSIKELRNHAPFQIKERYETIEEVTKDPLLSNDNLYLGTGLMQILKQNIVRPRFTKLTSHASTPLVWKVSFHLPLLPPEFSPVETQLSEFLCKLCYDNKLSLGECECLKMNTFTLYTSYQLVQGYGHEKTARQLLGSTLYMFVLSEHWETLGESYARFQASLDILNTDTEVVLLIYRSHYTTEQVLHEFNLTDSTGISCIKWNSAADVSHSIYSMFRSYFSTQHPTLCYENLSQFLSNEIEAVIQEVTDDKLYNPNDLIHIYNTLLSKLCLIIEDISLAPEFNTVLFKDSTTVVVINNNPEELDSFVTKLSLPQFKKWPLIRINKLKKLLKHFCAVIDRSGRNELFTIVMRLLNPPKDNLEQYLTRVNWSKILLPCFLWHLRGNMNALNNAYLFYNRENVKFELRSHWWV